MKLIKNTKIPFGKFNAIMLFGLVFYKELNDRMINHEWIHYKQYQEITASIAVPLIFLAAIFNWWILLLIPTFYYVWYSIEYLIRLLQYKSTNLAYRNISFEREAYAYDHLNYKDCKNTRVSFRWIKHLKKNNMAQLLQNSTIGGYGSDYVAELWDLKITLPL